VIIIYLVVKYSKGSMVVLFVYFALLVGLVYGTITSLVSLEILGVLQGLTIPIFAASKIPQIIQCFKVLPMICK